jgi:urease accessory protein
MLIEEKLGNLYTSPGSNCDIDVVMIEWHEANKRILHKQTKDGIAVTLKFLKQAPNLRDGDILWQDQHKIIVVEVLPCTCIVITPDSILTASSVCYEIGNRHLPLFYEGDDFLVPYEIPLYNLLEASGYAVKIGERKLNNALKTTVLPHLQVADIVSLPGKIIQPTTSL